MEINSTKRDIREIIGKRIKKEREERNLSQTQLGKLCNTSRGSISCYERAERTPDITMLMDFARIFNTSIDYLIGLTENRVPENVPIGERLGLTDSSIMTLETLKEDNSVSYSEILETINILLDIKYFKENIGYLRNVYAFIKTNLKKDYKMKIICHSIENITVDQEDLLHVLLLSNNSYLTKLREKVQNKT